MVIAAKCIHFTGTRCIASVCVTDSSPSGWDSEKKISILYEGLNSMRHDDAYNDVIARPVMRKVILT